MFQHRTFTHRLIHTDLFLQLANGFCQMRLRSVPNYQFWPFMWERKKKKPYDWYQCYHFYTVFINCQFINLYYYIYITHLFRKKNQFHVLTDDVKFIVKQDKTVLVIDVDNITSNYDVKLRKLKLYVPDLPSKLIDVPKQEKWSFPC